MTDKRDEVNAIETTEGSEAKVLNLDPFNPPKKRRGRPKKEDSPNEENASPEEDTSKRIQPAELYEAIFSSITKSAVNILPAVSFNIGTINLGDEGLKQVIEIDSQQVCKRIAVKRVADLIMNYTRISLLDRPAYRFTANHCRSAADYWEMASLPSQEPKLIRFLKDEGLCWHRIPFELSDAPTPLFDEIFSRMTNTDAVQAWIGSLFFEESYNQQFLWFFGRGNDSKSSLARALTKLLRPLTISQNIPPWTTDNIHWGAPYVNKRLIIFPDYKDKTSLDNPILKSLTGDDDAMIDPKFGVPYTTKLFCKLLFVANDLPNLEDQENNMRRAIVSEFTPTKSFDAKFETKLYAEMPSFLNQCLKKYLEICPNHEPISVDEDSKDAIRGNVSMKNDEYQGFFDKQIEVGENFRIIPADLLKRLGQVFQYERKLQDGFKQWLWITKGYKRSRAVIDNKQTWIYKGIRLRVSYTY